jgi:phosphomannomutase
VASEHDYLQAIAAEVPKLAPRQPATPLRIAYTALHGVGGELCAKALANAGFCDVHPVASQQQPDADFPTTPFPNPEEASTMDAVLALGANIGADLVLANDPDADRLAVAARDHKDALVMLSGNEVGVLLCDFLLQHAPVQADKTPLVCYSLVSTPMVERTAAVYGARALQTLTGFKWICNQAIAMEAVGFRFVFGFEEALGYAFGHAVRDKDGIAAALAIATLAADLASRGQSLWMALEQLSRRDGCYLSSHRALFLPGADGALTIATAVERLRTTPPASLSGAQVLSISDLQTGVCVDAGGNRTTTNLPRSNVMVLTLANDQRICVRPSGTEPKLKLYFDVSVNITQDEPFAQARARAMELLSALESSVLAFLGLNEDEGAAPH